MQPLCLGDRCCVVYPIYLVYRNLAGEPQAMERLADEMLYRENRERLICDSWLVPAERFSAGEQALLKAELSRMAGDAFTDAAVAVYTGRNDTEVELALQVPIGELSDAVRELIRRR